MRHIKPPARPWSHRPRFPNPPASLSTHPTPVSDPRRGRNRSGHEPYTAGTVHVSPGGPPPLRCPRRTPVIAASITHADTAARTARRTIRTTADRDMVALSLARFNTGLTP